MLKIQSVNHVSEHLSAIYPVYTPPEIVPRPDPGRMEGIMMLGAKQAIRTEGVMMLGAKRVVLAPSVNIRIDRPSGWTKAQPYEKELLPPEIVPRPDPGRMEGIMMLGAK